MILAPLAACLLALAPAAAPVPIADHYDVVIAGGGTGGTAAAIQAARLGASVLLLEETDWIGGQALAAAVTSMDEGGTLVRQRGLYREFVRRVEAHYHALGKSAETAYWGRHIAVEPRVGRTILQAMLDEAGRRSTLHLAVCAKVARVVRDGNAVTGVEVEWDGDAPARRTVACRVLIDATEWGDVLPLAGARYRVGNCTSDAIDRKRNIQMLTWTAVIKQYPGGVPKELTFDGPPPGYTPKVNALFTRSLVEGQAVSSKDRPWTFETFIRYRAMPDSARGGDWSPITRTHMNYNNDHPVRIGDVEDPASREETLRSARLKTLHLLYYVQQTLGKRDWSVADDEGFDSVYNRRQVDRWLADRPELKPCRPMLIHFSAMAYARESRRIVGLHTLTAREIDRQRGPTPFANAVALADYPIDLHGSMTPALLEMDLDRPEDIPGDFGGKGSGPFAVPFECFIPETVDGLLAAEKNISQTRLVNGATRLQPSTMLTGQAAGAIAALAIQHNRQPRQIDPVLVQAALLDGHSTLYYVPLKDVAGEGWEWKPAQLAAVRGLVSVEKGRFRPAAATTAAELRELVAKLDDAAASAVFRTASRGECAAAIAAVAKRWRVPIGRMPPPAAAAEPLPRAEAADVAMRLLLARAQTQATGRPHPLEWPAPLAPTPVSAADQEPQLAGDIERLTARGAIADGAYWLQNAVEGARCDGAKTAELLIGLARLYEPAADVAAAIEVLARRQIIGQPQYWRARSTAGRYSDGRSVAALLRHAAVHREAPPSAPAAR